MTRLVVAVAGILCAAGGALAAPSVPTRFFAVPVYSTPPRIVVSWTQEPGATSFTVYRTSDGAPEAILTSVPATKPGDRAVTDDGVIATGKRYTYRIEACDAAVCMRGPSFTTSLDWVWPVSGGRRVMTGHNENIGWAGVSADTGLAASFHDGLDLGRTTTGDTPADEVFAIRGGIVSGVIIPPAPSQDDAYVEISVTVADGTVEVDAFNHLSTSPPPTVMIGDAVAPGDRIGRIGTRHFDRATGPPSAFDDHVHYKLGGIGARKGSIRHPLSVFPLDVDRDPLGNLPGLNDENGDGKAVLYRDHTSGNILDYDLATKPLRGDLDVAVEVTDRQGTKPEQAPVQLGYWIEGPLPASEQLDDVKSAAHPYRLYDFRTEYWGVVPVTPCDVISATEDVANFGSRGVKTFGCLARPPSAMAAAFKEPGTGVEWGWPILHHFVVTHAGAETATRTALAKTQFWRTAAKDDGAAVGSTHANYAGQPTTTKAWEARFPDGDYTVHVLASDLVHQDVDLRLQPTRLENFAPFIRELLVTVDADGNPGTGRVETPGCEREVYGYRHPARKQYPDALTLAVARSDAGTMPIRAGAPICVRVRFSEPMNDVAVDLVRQRGAGTVLKSLVGALETANQTNDAWRGTATLNADPSGNSDSAIANDERDIAVRVTGRDRRDRDDHVRPLDTDGDGVANQTGDINHLVKIDLSPMKKRVSVPQ